MKTPRPLQKKIVCFLGFFFNKLLCLLEDLKKKLRKVVFLCDFDEDWQKCCQNSFVYYKDISSLEI
jgi:hypothetical protein